MSRKRSVIIDFSAFTEGELLTITFTIISELTTNAATFPALPVPVLTLTASRTAYEAALGAPISPTKTADIKAARDPFEEQLRDNGIYINTLADGDETILTQSGYPLSKEPEAQGILPRTTMIVESVENGFRFKIQPDAEIAGHTTVPGARGYIVLIEEIITGGTLPSDYSQWTWMYFPKSTGEINDLKASTRYRLVSTALGTHPTLVFSFPIDRTTQ